MWIVSSGNLDDLDVLAAEKRILDYLDDRLDDTDRAIVHDLVDFGYRVAVEHAAALKLRRMAVDSGPDDDPYVMGIVDAADLIDPSRDEE